MNTTTPTGFPDYLIDGSGVAKVAPTRAELKAQNRASAKQIIPAVDYEERKAHLDQGTDTSTA